MDKEILIANILKYCAEKKISPTSACVEAGCGKSFISDIKRGRMPSLDKFVSLAAYLDVTTSDLVGDRRDVPQKSPGEIFADFVNMLSEEQKAALLKAMQNSSGD